MLGTRLSIAAILVASGISLFAQPGDAPSIAGVWRLAEVIPDSAHARKMTSSAGLVIFTKRHYSISQVTSDKPRPDLPPKKEATDKQRADAYEPFTGQAGTYEIKGDEITVRPIAAMNPNLMRAGTFTTVSFVLEGDTLTITFKANEAGPFRNKPTMRYTRVE